MIKIQILNWKKTSTKIVVLVFSALLILSFYFIISSYKQYLNSAQESSLNNLQTTSNTLSLQIDPADIEHIVTLFISGINKKEVNNDSIFIHLQNTLDKVSIINKIKDPISIVFRDYKTDKFFYIANSSDPSESLSYFGDPYIKVPKEFKLKYETGGTLGPYTDEFGTYLTSLTPIKNKSNETICAIEVDLLFDSFIDKANTIMYKNLLTSIIFFLITSIVLLRYVRITLKQEESTTNIIKEKNQDILQSINYALRIQKAILPSIESIKRHLPNSFVLYKPKDIVAGDFYWMEEREGKTLYAVADCTGHGVPGAMVSVICNNALNRSVREYNLTEPGEILVKAREIVVQEFEKSSEEVKDGMDIALCSLEGNTLKYAGAYNPLWMIRSGELIEVQANKQPISQFDNPKPFITHSFELQKGDTLYIFSDGYVDQFGGEKEKKFKAKAFRGLLLGIQDKSMEDQKQIIDEAFEHWRGNLEQIDDVCVIGVKI